MTTTHQASASTLTTEVSGPLARAGTLLAAGGAAIGVQAFVGWVWGVEYPDWAHLPLAAGPLAIAAGALTMRRARRRTAYTAAGVLIGLWGIAAALVGAIGVVALKVGADSSGVFLYVFDPAVYLAYLGALILAFTLLRDPAVPRWGSAAFLAALVVDFVGLPFMAGVGLVVVGLSIAHRR